MSNDVVIHVKAEGNPDRDMNVLGRKTETAAKRSFLKSGGHAGAAFAAGFIKTVTFGMVGSGFAQAGMKLKPQMAHLGSALGVTVAAALAVKAASMLSALLPLALGAIMLAAPVAFLIKGMMKAEEEAKKSQNRVEALRKRYSEAKSADARKHILEQLEEEEAWVRHYRKQAQTLLELKTKAGDFMKEISKPVAVPLMKAMELIGNRLDDWGPRVRKALEPLAKELPGFIGGLMGGINNFFEAIGKKMPSITKGFKEWGKQLPGIGRALGEMVAAWIEDGPALVEGVRDTADSMKDLAKAVGTVGKSFRRFNEINDAFVEFREQVKLSAQNLRVQMLEALLTVFSALGKFSPRYRKIADEIRTMLAGARAEAKKTATEINNRKIKANIKADIADLQSKVRAAKQRLKETHNQKTRAAIKAEISDLQAKVRAAKAALAGVKSKTVTITARYVGGSLGTHDNPGPRASGGYIGGQHAAEGGPRGGQVLVGEQGPELVDLPMGSHVNSNADSRAQMGKRGRGGDIHITVNAPNYVGAPSDLLRALVDAKRRGQLDVILR